MESALLIARRRIPRLLRIDLKKGSPETLVVSLYHLYTILYSSLQFWHFSFDRLEALSELLSLAVPVRSFLRPRLACGVLGTNIDISKGELG